MCNTTGAAIQVYVHIVPPSGTAGTGNALYYNFTIPANTTWAWQGTQVLITSASLQAKASATGVTLTASGGEAT